MHITSVCVACVMTKKTTLLHCTLLLHCCHVFYSIVFPFYVTFIWVLVWEVNLASESWTGNLIYSEGEILAQHNTSWLYIKVISNTNNIYGNGKTKARWQKTISSTEILGHSWLWDEYGEWFVGLVIHKVHKPSYILETLGTLVTLKVEIAYMWFMISTLISLLFEMMLFCLPLLISWV